MAIREEEGASEGIMEGLQRKGSVTITRDDMAKAIKKYVKRLSQEKLLESYRFATIVECFGQISELMLDMGKKEEGYKLMDTASKINNVQLLSSDKEVIDILSDDKNWCPSKKEQLRRMGKAFLKASKEKK